jgi:hypothetical protein
LEKFKVAEANCVAIPLDPNVKLIKLATNHSKEMRNIPYPIAVGALMYAALATRLDIAFSIQKLSHLSSHPAPEHWTAAKRVLRYLLQTENFELVYGDHNDPEHKNITAYTTLIGHLTQMTGDLFLAMCSTLWGEL